MKKIALILTLILLASCSTNGRVCGGARGKRCVEVPEKPILTKIS